MLSTQYNFINLFSDSMKGWDLILNSENTFKTSGQFFTFFYCDGSNFILGLFMDIYEFIWEQNVLILPGKHHVQIVLKYCVLHTVPKIAESPF